MIDLPVYQSRIRNLGNDKSLAGFVLAFSRQILDFASNILRSSYLFSLFLILKSFYCKTKKVLALQKPSRAQENFLLYTPKIFPQHWIQRLEKEYPLASIA